MGEFKASTTDTARSRDALGIKAEGNNIYGSAHISMDIYWTKIIV